VAEDDQSSLIAALKRRDRSAWAAVVDRHLREVYGFIYHLVGGDRATAEELNQETWLEALGGIDRCDSGRGSFRNWLFGIARKRVALHHRRRISLDRRVSSRGDIEEAGELEDASILPEDVLDQVEREAAVRAAILVLPEDRREVLTWKYIEGLSIETISARTGRTAKAVESLLSRAREQMRSLLRGHAGASGGVQHAVKEPSHD
jgi:RNA polymerase sigma-70 factor (ECF subfamily)